MAGARIPGAQKHELNSATSRPSVTGAPQTQSVHPLLTDSLAAMFELPSMSTLGARVEASIRRKVRSWRKPDDRSEPRPIWVIPPVNRNGNNAVVFLSKTMKYDADGSPYAYHSPDNAHPNGMRQPTDGDHQADWGLDGLESGGGKFKGAITSWDASGNPQPANWYKNIDWWGVGHNPKTNEPYPQPSSGGFYVSTTALQGPSANPKGADADQKANVNASAIPYVVTYTNTRKYGAQLGTIAAVAKCSSSQIKDIQLAIAADTHGSDSGEGSAYLHQLLGNTNNNTDLKAESGGWLVFLYLVNSGLLTPSWSQSLSADDIVWLGNRYFDAWGGKDYLNFLYPYLVADRSS